MYSSSLLGTHLATAFSSAASRHADSALPGSRRGRRPVADPVGLPLTIRPAWPDDASAVASLAALEGVKAPVGEWLLGEIQGRVVAAVDLRGRTTLADPFTHSAGTVQLLQMRAAQLHEARR